MAEVQLGSNVLELLEVWGSVWVEEVSVVEDVVVVVVPDDPFFAFSLKHTEHRPSVSVELKNPHPLLQRVGKACCWLESKFLVLILTLWTKECQMFCWNPRPGDVVLVTIDGSLDSFSSQKTIKTRSEAPNRRNPNLFLITRLYYKLIRC